MAASLGAARGRRFSIPDRSGHLFRHPGRHPRRRAHRLAQHADEAIGLFIEYRDQHGYSEDAARYAAAVEVAEGIAAEAELRQVGQQPA